MPELSTVVDNSTLEVSSGTLRAKDAGITEAKQGLSDVTTNNVSTTKHGYVPKAPNDATKYLDGTGAWTVPAGSGGVSDGDKGDITVSGGGTVYTVDAATITEAKQVLADNTTQDVSTSKHGYVPKAPNDTAKFLRGDGTWATPAGGGGGALTLLEQHTASASASLDFTAAISGTYDEYLIEIIQLIPATNGAKLYMRMSTDGGSSYDSGNNYTEVRTEFSTSGIGAAGSNSGHGQIQLIAASTNNANWGIVGTVRLFNPGGAIYKRIVAQMNYPNGSSGREGCHCDGAYEVATAVNAFRFIMDTGNITSGVIRVYGISKT